MIENMKTSLNIEDSLFKAAQQTAQKYGRTLSDVISEWARVGKDTLTHKKTRPPFHPADLGGPAKVDLSSRRDWMDTLDS